MSSHIFAQLSNCITSLSRPDNYHAKLRAVRNPLSFVFCNDQLVKNPIPSSLKRSTLESQFGYGFYKFGIRNTRKYFVDNVRIFDYTWDPNFVETVSSRHRNLLPGSLSGCDMNISQVLPLFLSLACSAQTIRGNVHNGTTGNPEPWHQVILFTPSGEQASTITNEVGVFQIEPGKISDPHSTVILQVTHSGVEYFQSAHPGETANVKVYDSSKQVTGIRDHMTILQFQAKGELLQVTELHALTNASDPPTTKVDPDNLRFTIQEGARLRPATVSGPEGGTAKLPLVSIPGQTREYRIEFPIKPGLTKYALSYDVPYRGQWIFSRKAQYPMERIGVIVPDSMQFRPLGARKFHAIVDQPGTSEHILQGLSAGETFAFGLTGTGALGQSFHPLTPGEPSGVRGAVTKMRAHGELPVAKPRPAAAQINPIVQLALYICMLAFGVFAIWRLKLWMWAR